MPNEDVHPIIRFGVIVFFCSFIGLVIQIVFWLTHAIVPGCLMPTLVIMMVIAVHGAMRDGVPGGWE